MEKKYINRNVTEQTCLLLTVPFIKYSLGEINKDQKVVKQGITNDRTGSLIIKYNKL